MKPYVTQVWPQFTADAQFNSAFGGVVVERVELFRTSRTVVISLRSAAPFGPGAVRASFGVPAGRFCRV